MEGSLGRLEGGEAEWDEAEQKLTMTGAKGCRFTGRQDPEGPSIRSLRANELILDRKEKRLHLQGQVEGEMLPDPTAPPPPGWEGRLDHRAPWHFRCDNAWLQYEVEEVAILGDDPPPPEELPIARFHCDGGEGWVVVECKGNGIRLTGKEMAYDKEDGWVRLRGIPGSPPRLERGTESRSFILADRISVRSRPKEIVVQLDGGVRSTFHSSSIREDLPEETERIPGLLWRLNADRITATYGEEGLLRLVAEGDITFQAGSLEVVAERASYDGKEDRLEFDGDPVRASDGKTKGTARRVICDLAKGEIIAEDAKNWRIHPDVLRDAWREK
jgi:lipopolysaccharide export system protein LptA